MVLWVGNLDGVSRNKLGGVGGSLGSSVGARLIGTTTKGMLKWVTIGRLSKEAKEGIVLKEATGGVVNGVKGSGTLKEFTGSGSVDAEGWVLGNTMGEGVAEGALKGLTSANVVNGAEDGGALSGRGWVLKMSTGEGEGLVLSVSARGLGVVVKSWGLVGVVEGSFEGRAGLEVSGEGPVTRSGGE